ncbi:MAG: prepilin-type N-terminal cleavage/methylation domain-containing protein [Actinomycetes bacterium]
MPIPTAWHHGGAGVEEGGMLDAVRRARQVRRTVARPDAGTGPRAGEAGMSLIELVVAMTLLAVVMVGLSSSIGVAYRVVALGRQRQVAEATANKRLEELRDVDYAQMAMNEAPVRSIDPNSPDAFVSEDGASYDVTGNGDFEPLIVDAATPGPVLHVESPVVIGTTKVDVYQFVTWVDTPDVPGTQNLKRISVVVKYRDVSVPGSARVLRESVLFTNGTVTVPRAASTTTTSTTTTVPPTTTTIPANGCGSFSVSNGSGALVGFTATHTVTLTLAMGVCGEPVWVAFSNDGGTTYGAETAWDAANPTLGWTVNAGDGTKSIVGRARNAAGTTWSIGSRSVILDATNPTTPGTLNRTVTCSGSNRTVNLTWGSSTDTNLVGYRVYRSTDGVSWSIVSSTISLSASDTSAKTLTSLRFTIAAYDMAGNESTSSNTITLAKNQCS